MKTTLNYLIEIDMLDTTIRFSSHGDAEYQGEIYLDGLSVQSVSESELRFSLPNHKQQSAALFLNNPVRGALIRLYVMIDGIRAPKFDGLGDTLSSLTNDKAVIRAVSYFGESQFPNVQIAPPDFNHITASGTVIEFGGQTLEIS